MNEAGFYGFLLVASTFWLTIQAVVALRVVESLTLSTRPRRLAYAA